MSNDIHQGIGRTSQGGKHVYLVRHGETDANKKSIHQNPEEPLTVKGHKQALHAGLLLKSKNIDTLVCSPYTRARETAEIISKEINVPYIIDQSFTEFRRPENLFNKSHFSFLSLWYVWRMFLHREDANWNDHGAENMFAIRNRVIDAKDIITNLGGENIVIVSHTIFMNIFLNMACRESSLSIKEFMQALLHAKDTPNGGIIHLYYDENIPEGMCAWQLIEYLN